MLDQLDFLHEEDISIDTFLRKVEVIHPDASKEYLTKAYLFAEKAHHGQKRISGDAYFIHPVNVAYFLIKLKMDVDSIVSGLLHDVVEDCNVTEETIATEFSPGVALLVSGMTKISKIKIKSEEEGQAENFRKMIVAMSKDVRVIIVKLADRMHNIRTLQYMSEAKQRSISKETLDIYVPLAGRLGINSLKAQMEDLCLRFLHPEVYYKLAEKVSKKKSERDSYIREVVDFIKEKLQEYDVQADIKGRPKHFYSIYKKMQQRGVEFENIQDMLAFRIIVGNISECYKCLGVIHSTFTPIPGRFKDYIAIPKANNYQSLHTTVIGPQAERIEIQIRTFEMNEVAEKGVAAHWKYKEGKASPGNGTKLNWIEDLLEFNKNSSSNTEFMDFVKNDLDFGGIFVFTPSGDVIELRPGCTPLDFAYAIHTEVGNYCVGAKINGRIVPLKYRLKSGDIVEILTNKGQTPSKDWLKIVRSSKAKSKIRQWLLKNQREQDAVAGLEILEGFLKQRELTFKQFKKKGFLDKVIQYHNYKNEEDLFVYLAQGKIKVREIQKIIPELVKVENDPHDDEAKILADGSKTPKAIHIKSNSSPRGPVKIDGADDITVRLAKCCNPIPGDPISGHVTKGRGIAIHTYACKKKKSLDMERSIEASWNGDFRAKYSVMMKIISQDRQGILSTISKAINNIGVNIKSAMAKSTPDQRGMFMFEIEVQDYGELLKALGSVEALEEVISATRV